MHLHWRLVEPTRDPADHARLYEARALAAELVGADKTAVALVHPLRWAGSWHRKTDTPRLVRLKARPDVEIELGEALERLREAHAGSAAPKRGNGHDRDEEGRDLIAPLSKLAAAMAVIPNDEATSWEIWNRMGMALWVASSGQGFAIFDAWSLKHSKYDAGTTKARWEHYGKSPPDRIGAGTLFYLADQAAPGWLDRYVAAERAKKGAAESEEQALLNALAKKSPFEYEQARAEAAKKLNIRRSALDDLVDALRPRQDRDFLPHWKVEPWSEPVGGVALLGALREQFARYVVLPAHADVALALWTLLTWVFEQFDITPYLSITSPTRRCGKTVLMTLLYWLCRRGKKSDYMSRAAIYRSVENEKPTLVLDEVGWVVDAKDERQGILCGGFERNGYVELAEGEGAAITVRRFSTYCPKAFGLIGKLTTTLTDRAICIPMRRKRPAEKVARLRRRDNDEFAKLRRQCLRWANDNAEALAKAPTAVIEQLHDRAVDAWAPLAVISDHVGGEWPALARAAALALSGEADDNSVNIRLLRDVRWILDGRPVTNETTGDVDREFDPLEKVHSETLVGYLTAIADSSWADWKGAKGFTQNALASRLEDFGIHPRNIRLGGTVKKGYAREQFKEAFEAYLSSLSPVGGL